MSYNSCLCGDPECPRCFPGSFRATRELNVLKDKMDKAGAGCPHVLDSPRQARKYHGLTYCVPCLCEQFDFARARKQAAKENRSWTPPAPKWESEYED